MYVKMQIFQLCTSITHSILSNNLADESRDSSGYIECKIYQIKRDCCDLDYVSNYNNAAFGSQ